MKRIVPYLFCFSLSGIISCGNNREPVKASADAISISASADSNRAKAESEKGKPVLQFDKTEHDFGRITSGEKVAYAFKFTNTGKGELLIASAYASCGCTIPEYSKEPILPGATGVIKVKFDSYLREDYFTKTITVMSNTEPNSTTLTIRGFIIPKEVLEPGMKQQH